MNPSVRLRVPGLIQFSIFQDENIAYVMVNLNINSELIFVAQKLIEGIRQKVEQTLWNLGNKKEVKVYNENISIKEDE